MQRDEILSALKKKAEVSLLIVGGGFNGIGTFRDLALNGVDVLLRRSMLAMLGRVTGKMLDELVKALGNALGWDEERKANEVTHPLLILSDRHGVRL
jgi:glycerol-3-phosphate dehydrogenase